MIGATTRALLWLLAGLLLGVFVHLVSLLAIPALAGRTGQQRLAAAIGGAPGFQLVPRDADLPGRDPALDEAACRYDLARGPVRVSVPADAALVSLSVIPERGPPVFSAGPDTAAEGRIEMVLSRAAEALSETGTVIHLRPRQARGFVMLRRLRSEGAEALPADVQCGAPSLPQDAKTLAGEGAP